MNRAYQLLVLVAVFAFTERTALGAEPAKSSALDALDAKDIPPEELPKGAPKELVGIIRAAGQTASVYCVGFSPDGSKLATGGLGQFVQVWDLKTLKLSEQFPPNKTSTLSVAFPTNDRLLALADFAKCRLWAVGEKADKPKDILTGSNCAYQQVAVDSTGRRVALDTDDGVQVYDLSTTPPTVLYSLKSGDYVVAMAFSKDGKMLATATRERLCVWQVDAKEVKKLVEYKTEQTSAFLAVCCSRSGDTVVVATGAGALVVKDGKLVRTLDPHKKAVVGAVFLGDDAWPLLTADDEGRLLVCSEEGKVLADISTKAEFLALALSHDRRYAATGNKDGTAYIFRLPVVK